MFLLFLRWPRLALPSLTPRHPLRESRLPLLGYSGSTIEEEVEGTEVDCQGVGARELPRVLETKKGVFRTRGHLLVLELVGACLASH